MSSTLAGPTTPTPNAEIAVQPEMILVRQAAARLYGSGYRRPDIARMLTDHLTPRSSLKSRSQKRFLVAKNKLAKWEKEQEFRDLIWEMAVAKLDLESPAILDGVAKKARRGNVMAARLALEVTGRHNPKGDSVPTQIAIVVNGIPRPGHVVESQHAIVQAVEAEDDEDDEV